MNALEIVKKIDSQGRVTIPLPFRQKLEISPEDELSIECEEHTITIRRKRNLCRLCEKEIPFNCWFCSSCKKIVGEHNDLF